jgi:hypothetical protein
MSGGLGPDIISPIYTSTASKDKLTNEMVRLKLEIPMPTRKVRGTELTPQQYWGFVAAAGQPAKAVLDKIVSQPGWDEIGQRPGGNELQEDIIRRTVDQFRELARARLFAETDILQKEAERRVAPFVQ